MQYSTRAREQVTLFKKKTNPSHQNLVNISRNKTQLQSIASGIKNKPEDKKMNSDN
jgi:hypothetical protein